MRTGVNGGGMMRSLIYLLDCGEESIVPKPYLVLMKNLFFSISLNAICSPHDIHMYLES
jgi:hypothetical protein